MICVASHFVVINKSKKAYFIPLGHQLAVPKCKTPSHTPYFRVMTTTAYQQMKTVILDTLVSAVHYLRDILR